LERVKPRFHVFGHYGGPCRQWQASNGVTEAYKLTDAHADQT
jgi:hypothetical protein